MHTRYRGLHMLGLMCIRLKTIGKTSYGLMNHHLKLASIHSCYKFGIRHMNGILWIAQHQLLSLAMFMSWYGDVLVAMINLPQSPHLQIGGLQLILLTQFTNEHYLAFISSMLIQMICFLWKMMLQSTIVVYCNYGENSSHGKFKLATVFSRS